MRRSARLAAVTAAAMALALGGCTGASSPDGPDGSQPSLSPSSDGERSPVATAPREPTAPPPELGVVYPTPADVARPVPDSLGTLTGSSGEEFTLTGVFRLADDRVAVTGLLDIPGGGAAVMSQWEEPGFAPPSIVHGLEFAPFTLTVEGDGSTYLPVREDDVSCLCSVLRAGFEDQGPMAVMTVMSAPADADRVALAMDGYGTFDDVAVAAVPESDTSILGSKETLTVQDPERSGGVITARVTLAVHESGSRFGYGSYQFTDQQLCFGGLTAVGTGTGTGTGTASETECTTGAFPEEAGQAVDLEVTMPDPGSDDVVFLPWNGMPFTMPVSGDAAAGTGEDHRSFAARTRVAGTTVTNGTSVRVALDTAVLFENLAADLTPDAERTLAAAVAALQAQDGRTVAIEGHTDSRGEEAFNQQLSLARAEAVRAALERDLGPGWTYSVNGYGETRPLAAETGTPEQVEEAQARNRRVEVAVGR